MILLLLAACRSPETPDPPESRFDEPWRPQVHFTPASGWMNDPVGLVYFQGKYHLFYQHDPRSLSWGPMHWGHATSDDLVRWEHQAVALAPDDALGAAWSGSAWVDETDEMGFCGAAPCLVLAYTLAGETQQIGLATSSDGETFTPYAGNPVVPNPGQAHFRDPDLFRWTDGTWRMAIAEGDRIGFWASSDLREWDRVGETVIETGGMLECPDLFDAGPYWAMLVSTNPGGPAGGSGQLVVHGSFDGSSFTPSAEPKPFDYGPDAYAFQTFAGAEDLVAVGWMSNWRYALQTPTTPWRGALTTFREIRPHFTDELTQVAELGAPWEWLLEEERVPVTSEIVAGIDALPIVIRAELDRPRGVTAGLELFVGDGEPVRVGVNDQIVWLERPGDGANAFSDDFAGRFEAPLIDVDDDLTIVVDRSSVEVFASDGRVALTATVYPSPDATGLRAFADGEAFFDSLLIGRHATIWPEEE
jgi:fructan beta-fructosidase